MAVSATLFFISDSSIVLDPCISFVKCSISKQLFQIISHFRIYFFFGCNIAWKPWSSFTFSAKLFFLCRLIWFRNSWHESAMLPQSPEQQPNPSCLEKPQFVLCNLLTTVVGATLRCHSDLLPTSYNQRKNGETPARTEMVLRCGFMAGEDVRHLQSILTRFVSQCVCMSLCNICIRAYWSMLVTHWLSVGCLHLTSIPKPLPVSNMTKTFVSDFVDKQGPALA